MVRVKICGITNLADALAAAEAGADALGFIFVEHTPRFVRPEQVAPIVRALPPFVTPVGVFWDHAAGHVKAVAEACGLRVLQFHGDEKPEDLDGHALPVIKTVKLPPAGTVAGLPEYSTGKDLKLIRPYVGRAAAILLDSEARWSDGERRRPVEWQLASMLKVGRCPVILSGGLTPDNVADAIAAVAPWGVDVNSGVEARPGRKDLDLVRRFVDAAKRAAPP
ncbi:MAG TPA: phosphoribosylanthranilate isomerase [Methylomirabilota bacterium]|nr:phosphoribosylanthranilate isomerase [Methylomirabilota bacterium]